MSEETLKTEFLTTSEDQLKNQPDFKDSSLIENADVDLAELNVK